MLQSIAAASVVGSLTPEVSAKIAPAAPRPAPASRSDRTDSRAPWTLLAPLQAGDALGLGWVLGDLEPVRRGAAVLVLDGPDGRSARVHLCRRGDVPVGVASTEEVDLVLMNGGDGDDPTVESLGRVLRSLAARMTGPSPRGLMTHADRIAAYDGDHEALT